ALDPAGPSGPFRSRDLANLIRSAVARARVFGLAARNDSTEMERALAAIAAGDYTFSCEFWADGERQEGDVIALPLDSTVSAARAALAGAGAPYGLIRLGRATFERVASGGALEAPTGWARAAFAPPALGTAQLGDQSPADENGADRRGTSDDRREF